MDNHQIAIWVTIFLLFILIVFRPNVSFYGLTDKSSLMDLSEFKNVPSEVKKVYVDNFVNKIAATAGKMVADDWNKTSKKQKQEWIKQISTRADNTVKMMREQKAGELPAVFSDTTKQPMTGAVYSDTTKQMNKMSSYIPFGTSGYSLFDPSILQSMGI